MNVTLVRIFFLIVMWWICSVIAEPFFLVAGFVSVWLTWQIAVRMKLLQDASLFHKPLQLILYVGWLIKEITLSTISVARIIWQVKPRITPCLFEVETKLKDDLALSLYGNSITLTPGTACVNIVGKKIQVHALVKANAADIKSGRMEKEIAKVVA